MKKNLLIYVSLLGLVSCNQAPSKSNLDKCIYNPGQYVEQVDYKLDLSVLAPQGAPAVALYQFATCDKLTTTSNPQTGIIPMFQSGEYDVIVAPTQGGLNQIVNLGAQYKIAATITFGNFYIVSMGTDSDNTLNAGDKVIIFQENDIPGKVFKYLYSDLGLTVTAVAGAQDTKSIMANNGIFDGVQYDYVYTAEPVMSASNRTAFINVQDAFKEKSGGKLMTQASVFVKKGLDSTKVDSFLFALQDGITKGLANTALIKTEIEKLGSTAEQQNVFGVPGAMAKKVSDNNGFGLGYKNAKDIKGDIKEFIGLISPNIVL